MDKLSRYNQKLLAAIGTLVLAILCISIVVAGAQLIANFFQNMSDQRIFDNALTVEAPESDSTQARMQDQQATFETPILIDTPNAIYIIPISQVNLEVPEIVSVPELGLMDSYGLDEASIYLHTGVYNNIVVYNQKESSNALVFDRKTHVGLFQNHKVDSNQYLLMVGTQTDSNQDNKLNDEDLQSFFVYNMATQELKAFAFSTMGLVDFYVMHRSDEVILRFAMDKDQNGEVSRFQEPVYLKRLALSNYKVTDLVDQSMVDKIQSLVD